MERSLATADLAHEHTKRPNVDFIAMAIGASEHFRRYISRSSAIGEGLLLDGLETFGKAKVDDLQVASVRLTDNDILGLQVSKDDLVLVEVLESHENLSGVVDHV